MEQTKVEFPDEFDMPTAVALAGCAFEAYLEPEGEEIWKTNDSKGTSLTFTDRWRFIFLWQDVRIFRRKSDGV